MVTKSFNIDEGLLDNLMRLYPGASFTNVMLDLIDNRIKSSKMPTTDDNELIEVVNKLKSDMSKYRDITNKRLDNIDNLFDELKNK